MYVVHILQLQLFHDFMILVLIHGFTQSQNGSMPAMVKNGMNLDTNIYNYVPLAQCITCQFTVLFTQLIWT